MSFREKSAWISFVLVLVVFTVYFAKVASIVTTGSGARQAVPLFLALIFALIVLEVILHVCRHDEFAARCAHAER